MEIKKQIFEELMCYFKKELSPEIRSQISSSAMLEILSCTTNWAFTKRDEWHLEYSKMLEHRIKRDVERAKNDLEYSEDENVQQPELDNEFLAELKKL